MSEVSLTLGPPQGEIRPDHPLVERVLAAAADAMLVVDGTGTIRLVNQLAESLFGYSRAELVGQPVELLVPDSLRQAHSRLTSRFVAHPVTRPMGAGLELSGRRRDGSQFPADISLSAVETEHGQVVIAAVRDLSGLRAIRESLRETREIAEILQHSLLDDVPGRVNGLAVAVRYQPAESGATVGGDWYDVFPLPDGLVGLTVGDVSGHGIQAAATMGRLRTALATLAWVEDSPARVLAEVNRMLCRTPGPRERRHRHLTSDQDGPADAPVNDQFATALYGRLDPGSREFTYAVAGHPGPIVADTASGAARLQAPEPDLPLGLVPGAGYADHRVELPETGRLLAFTDGLYERRGTSIGESLDALVAAVAGLAGRDVDEIADTLRHTLDPIIPERSDDLALVVTGW
ncbi:MAG: SpoIIE family protein phosphatase [Actinomycetales bacterium]|nr:SpoIIE family protein phosphatase [Actinomycetales bacterium]